MKEVQIVTDEVSDLPDAWREEYGIDVATLTLDWEGKEGEVTVDTTWDTFTPKEYYDALRAGKMIKSNQTQPKVMEDLFNKYVSQGKAVVYMACTTGISGCYNVGVAAAQKIKEQNPDAEIYCINGRCSGGGESLCVREAAKLAQAGKSAKEIADIMEVMSHNVFQAGSVQDLKYLKRSGRLKASAAFFGNMFGVKPIVVNDRGGANLAIKKVKGRQASIEACVAMLKETMNYPGQTYPASEQTVFLGHADCEPEEVEKIKALIESEIHPKDIIVNYVGPCIGASVGPGMFCLYGFGQSVEDRFPEKA